MKTFMYLFMIQLLIIGMAINVRTDISFWKQMIGYSLIACILPISYLLSKNKVVKNKD